MTKERNSFSASLQVTSKRLRASEIARILHVDGATVQEAGEPQTARRGSRVLQHAVWRMQSPLAEHEPIEKHLDIIASLLDRKRDEFNSLADKCELEVWCFLSLRESQYGFSLNHEMMSRLTQAGVDVIFDVYS